MASPSTEPSGSPLGKEPKPQVIPPLTGKQFICLVALVVIGVSGAIALVYGKITIDDLIKIVITVASMAVSAIALGRDPK